MARFFSLKSIPLNMWVMWVYIVWVKRWCIKYDKIAKQKVSQVSCGKALPSKYLQKLAVMTLHIPVMTLHIPVMCCAHGFTSQEVFSRAIRENSFDLQCCLESSHSLSHITHTMKSHIKYRVHKIEENYNKIWHRIKANTK